MAAGLGLVVILVGLSYVLWGNRLEATGELVNVDFVAASTNDPPGSIDPGYDKNVATCKARVVSAKEVAVVLTNAYPSYTCTFTTTIRNSGRLTVRRGPLQIDAPPVLTVTEIGAPGDIVIKPCRDDIEKFSIHVEQQAQQGSTYAFTIRKPFEVFVQGTIGFWKNWDSHDTFTRAEIKGWLTQIDASSAWLGPVTTSGMEAMFQAGLAESATAKSRFLAHYLATRLNERSGILAAADTHNVTSKDPHNYLGLARPTSATLAEIIAAIEAKFGTSPTRSQYNIMKEICDALNQRTT